MSIPAPKANDPRYTKRNALYVPAGEGTTIWTAGDTYTLKADAKSTNGSLTLLEASVPPGGGPEPHAHNNHDEAFYMISGEPGGFFFVPRGTRHRFINRGLHPAKMIFLFTPGGMEEVLLATSEPARPGETPDPQRTDVSPIDPEFLARFAEMLPDL
jgi:mannose-6-phosphate isomerase-like protein (cupin superfamily)